MSHRHLAGVTVPLFSLRSQRSWGIGEIGDLPELAQWVHEAGIRLIQVLPLGAIADDETSPYSAMTAFGIDPMYISLAEVAEVGDDLDLVLGGVEGTELLARVRARQSVDYTAVRTLKRQALLFAFQRFSAHDLASSSPRAHLFHAFRAQNRAWLDDYTLFRALNDAHEGVAWWKWEGPLQMRDPVALARAAERYRHEILFHAYLQWLAHTQWYEVRAHLAAIGVELMGDLPFMVRRDSCDVWANQREFRQDFSVGAPPDFFDPDGQEWTLPPYHWERMRENDFAWLRRRARYTASLFDRFRIDHVVGFYRTYIRPVNALRDAAGKLLAGFFDPGTPEAQLAHGERVISAMSEAAREAGGELIAEDLGVIPDFVRASLPRLEVPGYKVVIWEKDDRAFRDPTAYARSSVACFGTHDTNPVAVWWEGLDEGEREAVRAIPLLAPRAKELGRAFTPAVHSALFDLLNAAGSDLVLFLIQDLLGVRDRINLPSTVGPHNWSYRLPGTVEEMRRDRHVTQLMTMLRHSTEKSGRAGLRLPELGP